MPQLRPPDLADSAMPPISEPGVDRCAEQGFGSVQFLAQFADGCVGTFVCHVMKAYGEGVFAVVGQQIGLGG